MNLRPIGQGTAWILVACLLGLAVCLGYLYFTYGGMGFGGWLRHLLHQPSSERLDRLVHKMSAATIDRAAISHEQRPDYMTPEQWEMSVQRAALIGAANTIVQEWNKWTRKEKS